MTNGALRSLTAEELIRRLRSASPVDATPYCQELIRRFEPLLRRTWRRIAFRIEYEDFVQDVFLRLFRTLARLENPKAFPGYFRRVILSVAIDHARRLRSTVPETQTIAEAASTVDTEIYDAILVRSYLEHLPPQEQAVIKLGYLEGLDTSEVAKRLGITPGGVRGTKARAFKRLRAILLEEAERLEGSPGNG